MHNFGCPPQACGNDTIMMLCLLMMMCPGLFNGMGENPMMFMIMLMLMTGGKF